jgi:hypothetical protein
METAEEEWKCLEEIRRSTLGLLEEGTVEIKRSGWLKLKTACGVIISASQTKGAVMDCLDFRTEQRSEKRFRFVNKSRVFLIHFVNKSHAFLIHFNFHASTGKMHEACRTSWMEQQDLALQRS